MMFLQLLEIIDGRILASSFAIAAVFLAVVLLFYRSRQSLSGSSISFMSVTKPGIGVLTEALTGSFYQATAGGELKNFFDLDKIKMNSSDASCLTNFLSESIKEIISSHEDNLSWKICFIEKDSGPVGAITLKGLVEAQTNLASSIIRVKKRLDSAVVKGLPILPGDWIILVSDVITSGFQTRLARKRIERLGGRVSHVIAIVDRRTSKQNLERDGIHVKSFIGLEELKSLVN